MENKKEKEPHICSTCKHFTQHYRQLSDGTYRKTACGFCSNDLAHLLKRRQPPLRSSCRFWDSKQELTLDELRQENIKEIKEALSGIERMIAKLDNLVDGDIF